MPTSIRFYVEARCDTFAESVGKLSKGIQNGPADEPIGVGALYRSFRTVQSAIAALGGEIDEKRQAVVAESYRRLEAVVGNYADKVRHVAWIEIGGGVTGFGVYLDDLESNEPEDFADMLNIRSSLHELFVLGERLGLDLEEPRKSLDRLDRELRNSEDAVRRIGTPFHRFWVDNAPAEYWWWQLAKE
jgi:hypothetical protein